MSARALSETTEKAYVVEIFLDDDWAPILMEG